MDTYFWPLKDFKEYEMQTISIFFHDWIFLFIPKDIKNLERNKDYNNCLVSNMAR